MSNPDNKPFSPKSFDSAAIILKVPTGSGGVT